MSHQKVIITKHVSAVVMVTASEFDFSPITLMLKRLKT